MEPAQIRLLKLTAVKILHTLVWTFVVACILAIPLAAVQRQFHWAVTFSGIVLIECLVLAVNRFRCPLTDLASRYTSERIENFDIFLPLWLARRNKLIFGTLFAAVEVFSLCFWCVSPR